MKHSPNRFLPVLLSLTMPMMLSLSAAAQPCGSIQQTTTPNPGTTGNALVDLAASNDGTAWAIGSRSGPTSLPLILYFDGTTWTEYPVPMEVDGIAFSSAGSTPDGDVWLAGTRAYSVYERELFFLRARGGVIDRIDQILSAGAPLDISATSSTDVWVLTSKNAVIHFDGSGWFQSDLPQPFLVLNYPEAIHATSPEEVWIVGYGGDRRGEYKSFVQRWDGSSATSISTPVDGQQVTFLLDIDGSGADDVWIVGHVNYSQHLSLHWDGNTWSQVEGPGSNAPLTQVVVLAPDNVWAAPYSLTAGSTFSQWDGGGWDEVSGPDIPGASTTAWRGLAKVGACDLWAAGSYYSAPNHYTLAARLSLFADGFESGGTSRWSVNIP